MSARESRLAQNVIGNREVKGLGRDTLHRLQNQPIHMLSMLCLIPWRAVNRTKMNGNIDFITFLARGTLGLIVVCLLCDWKVATFCSSYSERENN
jgi:hypothetical protein